MLLTTDPPAPWWANVVIAVVGFLGLGAVAIKAWLDTQPKRPAPGPEPITPKLEEMAAAVHDLRGELAELSSTLGPEVRRIGAVLSESATNVARIERRIVALRGHAPDEDDA